MEPQFSILVATRGPDRIPGFLAALEASLARPESCEVLIKIDDDDPAARAALAAERERRRVAVRIFSGPRGAGYWDLWQGYNRMCRELAPSSRYVMGVNDGCRFTTQGWDRSLLERPAPFADGIFHWRLSARRDYRFRSLVECLPYGESFGIFSRRWIDLTGGWAIGPACGDTGQECVNFFLRRFHGLERGVPLALTGVQDEARAVCPADGLTPERWREKQHRILALYAQVLARDFCESHFARAAAGLAAAVAAHGRGAASPPHADAAAKVVRVTDAAGTILAEKSYALDFAGWVGLIFSHESVGPRDFDWPRWPPLLANQLAARRVAAEMLLDASGPDLPVAPETFALVAGTDARNHPPGELALATIAPHLDAFLAREKRAPESAFRQRLFDTALARPPVSGRPGPILAAMLYLADATILIEGLDLSPVPPAYRAGFNLRPRRRKWWRRLWGALRARAPRPAL